MLTILVKYLKPASYIVVALMVVVVLWGLYKTIKDNGRYEGIIATQQSTIVDQSIQIEALSQIIDLTNTIIAERDIELNELQDQMQGLSQGLGEDADDPAARSLKEYFERLGRK